MATATNANCFAARRRSRRSSRTKRKRCKGKRKSCKSGASATHDSKSPQMRLQVRAGRQTGAFNDAKMPKKPSGKTKETPKWRKEEKRGRKESKPKPKLQLR